MFDMRPSGHPILLFSIFAVVASLVFGAWGEPLSVTKQDEVYPDAFGPISPKDNTALFQKAVDTLCARLPRGGTIRMRARTYVFAPKSSIATTCAVRWLGEGWSEAPGAAGTWLRIAQGGSTHDGGRSLFSVGPGGAGTRFEGFGVAQDQPAPAPGWTPTVYPPVFDLRSVAGGVFLRDIIADPVYDLVSSVGSGRTDLCGLYGQVLHRGVTIDLSFDTTHASCGAIHFWPYWSQSDHVTSWTAQNADVLTLGRVDGGDFPDIFAYAYRSAVRFVTSSNGGAKLGGAQYASGVHFGRVYADSTRIAVWFNGASASSGIAFPNEITFDSIYAACLGVGAPVSVTSNLNQAGYAAATTPQPGSFGVLVDSNGAVQAVIASLSVYGCSDSALSLGNVNLPSFFRIGMLRTRNAGTVAIFAPSVTGAGQSPSDIAVATKPDTDVNEFGPPGASTLVDIPRLPAYAQEIETGRAYQYGRSRTAQPENNAELMVLTAPGPRDGITVSLPTSPYNGQTASVVSLVTVRSFRFTSEQRVIGQVPSTLSANKALTFNFVSGIGWIKTQ